MLDLPTTPDRPTLARGWATAAMRRGALVGAGSAVGAWIGDAAALWSSRGGAGTASWVVGVGAALFVALSAALPLGALAGLLIAPVATDVMGGLRALRRALREGDAARHRELASVLLASSALPVACASAAYRASMAAVSRFARPASMAATLAASHVAFMLLLLLAWPVTLRAARRVVALASAAPGPRWVVARAERVAVALCLVTLAAGALFVAGRWELVRALPWHRTPTLVGLVVGALGSSLLVGARSAFALRATLALLAGSAVCAASVRPESAAARRIAFEHALSGSAGSAAWNYAFDFDRDGQLGFLGGGDCAPLDPRRYTGAIETPGNGIDEDCDGADLSEAALRPRSRVRLAPGSTPERPSVVLVTVDALAARRLRSIGSGTSVMPNLDALAGRSAVFARCFAQGPSTRLSFPSMFTSRWDSQLPRTFAPRPPYPLASSERQLQDVLDAAGYLTVAVVSDPYFLPRAWPSITRGFQRVDTSAASLGKHNSPRVTDAALRAIGGPRDRPLYLWVHYYDAHAPYHRPPNTPAGLSDEALYDAELGYVDREIGRLVAAIEARPEPTWIFVTGDHGTVFHPHPAMRRGRYGYDLYTATLHVPLVVRGPGVAPRRVDGLTSTMDIAPTVADLARVDAPPAFEGTSLVPELLQGARDEGRVVFHEFFLGEQGFRGEDPLQIVSLHAGRWNMVLDRVRGTVELYDWTRDYFEERNLYADLARTPEVLRLRSRLGAFVEHFHRRPDRDSMLEQAAVDRCAGLGVAR